MRSAKIRKKNREVVQLYSHQTRGATKQRFKTAAWCTFLSYPLPIRSKVNYLTILDVIAQYISLIIVNLPSNGQ